MTGSPGAFLCRGLKNSAADPGGIVSAEELHAYAAPKTTAYKPSIHPQLKDNYSGDLDLSSLPSPQNLVITNRDNCGENPHLTWDASSGAESYKVYRSTDQHNWQVIATTTNTSYTDCDVIIQKPRTADDQFYYKVTALSSSSESDASRTVTTWGRILEKQITDLDKVTSEQEKLPKEFALLQNYPNPGNPTTNICFQLPKSRHVVLKIFNVLGQEVKTLVDDYREAGTYSVIWDGRDNRGIEVPSGIYLYTLRVGDKVFTKKLMFLK